MPFTFILASLYVLAMITGVIGFLKKLSVLKWLAGILFLAAVILTAILGFGLNKM